MFYVDLYGFEVKVLFLMNDEVLAYSWHYDEARALRHLHRIVEFHKIDGEIVKSKSLEKWLRSKIDEVVLEGARFKLPNVEYKNRVVYENIIKIPRGKTATYSQIARESGVKYKDLLQTLMRNPFQVLVPCHRLVTNKGTLFGFYPLGKGVKRRLLEIEGAILQ